METLYEIESVILNRFRLDGGAMFGSVPREVWKRYEPPDERNRIALVARCLLLRSASACVLVDTGVGTKLSPTDAERFAVTVTSDAELPFRWEELTHVLPTHLHFDHGGGLTRWGDEAGAGDPQRAAPNAEIVLQRANWERARQPGVRERASYLPENVEPLASGPLRLLDGNDTPLPGIEVFRSDGHTAGMQWVKVATRDGTAAFPADLIPTTSHCHLPFVMGYDMCVEKLLREKSEFLEQAVSGQWTVVFAHDSRVAAARIGRDNKGRFCVAEEIKV